MANKDLTYLEHIIDSINDLELFVAGYSEETFLNDKKTFNASMRMFEIIGEASKRLSTELKNKNNSIEWKKIAGLRDVLIHDYEGVDIRAVWQIIIINIPELKKQIQTIIKTL